MDGDSSQSKKMKFSKLSEEDLKNMKQEDLVQRFLLLQEEVEGLGSKQNKDQSLDVLHETVEKLMQQVKESARQESMLAQRLASKDHELQEILAQQSALKVARNASAAQIQNMMLDPAVNLMFIHMKQEMEMSKTKLDETQAELAAWKFTPDSQTGKRLMAKCRMLLQENEELGKTVSAGRIAKLEGDIALKEKLIEEMKKSEKETEEFIAEMDEDMESMQNTVYLLQKELKDARERLRYYEQSFGEPMNTMTSGEQDIVLNGNSQAAYDKHSDKHSDEKLNTRIDERYANKRTLDDYDNESFLKHSNKLSINSEPMMLNQSPDRTHDYDCVNHSEDCSSSRCRNNRGDGNNLKITLRTNKTTGKNIDNDESAENAMSARTIDNKCRTMMNDTGYRTAMEADNLSLNSFVSTTTANSSLDNLSNVVMTGD